MSEIQLTDNWPIYKSRKRLEELQSEINQVSKRMSAIDRLILDLEKDKEKLCKKMSHSMKYRNAIINDISEKENDR